MNKIYKVIWSKVKNQYVVVSELAHSNGKQSRTSRNSIRSRIAALVVCGAIAAFGVFSALPTSSAFAEDVAKANEYQYVAIKATDDSDTKVYKDPSSEKTYNYHSEFINGERYWVRDGYTIEQIEGKRFPEAQKTAQIQAIKSPNASTEGLLQSNRVVLSTPGQSTVLGDTLQKVDVGVYMGATNEGGTITPSSWNYYIQKNDGSYIDAGGANFDTYFVEAEKQADGTYQVNGKTVSSENLYVINDRIYTGTNDKGEAQYKLEETDNNLKLGAFVVDGQIYTKNVFGKYNEVLMSAQQGNTYYSYWAADTYDADAPMQLTQGQYKNIVDTMWGNDTYLASSDVSKIELKEVSEENKKGGTISLLQHGDYNSETNSYENNKTLPGAITVTSEGGTGGKDVAIRFSNEDNLDGFTVDAGSKVVGKITESGVQQEADADDVNKTLTGLKINGVDYALSQGKTYSPGQGIAISEDTNKISVDKGDGLEFTSSTDGEKLKVNANEDKGITVDGSGVAVNAGDGLAFETQEGEDKGKLKVNVGDGLSIADGKVVNNLEISGAVTNDHKDGGNWTITDNKGTPEDTDDVTFKNTTLSSSVTSGNEVNNGKEDDKKVVYGKDYTISDTDGNTATIEDVASADKLKDVDTRLITTEGKVETINGTLAGAVMYDKVGNSYDKSLVTLGGTTYDKDDEDTGTRLTNVAYADVNGENTGSDAVNVDLLKDYVDENGGGSWNLTTSQDDNETTVGKGNTVDLAGATKGEGSAAHQNIHVTQETQYDDEGNVTGTNVKFDLDDKLVLGDNDQITIDGSDGKATIKLGNSTSGTATIGGIDIATTTTDGKTSSTIDGLTNNTWDNNNTNQYDDSKKAATEGQLYDALTGLSKEADVAVVHADKDGKKDANSNNLKDTKATIVNEAGSDERSSSIALGNGAKVSVQNGYKSQGILFGNETYTGGIAIGQEATALNGTVNIGVKDYKGQMGDVTISSNSSSGAGSNEAYNTYPASGTGETSVGSNSYISGMLSTNTGSYNIVSTKYMNTDPERILGRDVSSLYALQNTGAVVMGTLNSIESNTSKDNAISIATNIVFSGNDDSVSAKISGVANNVVGMANKTNNTNGSLIFGTGNEITNSLDDIPLPDSVIESIKNEILSNHGGTITQENASEIAEEFRKAVADRKNQNGGAVLAIGGGNKADYALNSQLIGVQNQITGTKDAASQYNMVNGYQNTVENGSNDTVIGVKNTVTNGDSNVVLGDNHTVQNANNNVILGSSDKETTHTVSDTVVIGHNAQANSNNDVAIGSGSVANGAVKTAGYAGANPIGTVSVGSEGNERTITNVAAGRISDTSTDAVNGSQLYTVQQEAGRHTEITVNGGVAAPDDGTYTHDEQGHLDGNLLLKQSEGTNGQTVYDLKLNPDITLQSEDDKLETQDNRVELSGSNGTIMATTDFNDMSATTTINGGNVYVGNSVSVGDKVVMTNEDITGLSNTNWDGTTDNVSRAATEGQLK
ncbi:ESPR-type extended signal peptide-containing protein, partial [Megamonas hypermegale]|uniref:ESPR-type extended signal peptide-containing protein n=1 Tax=Megamonas hypermegale TaxID=158847 RepID=UPI0025A34388